MRPRILAVASPQPDGDRDHAVELFVGALATFADVSLLTTSANPPRRPYEDVGAFDVLTFPSDGTVIRGRTAPEEALRGPTDALVSTCSCHLGRVTADVQHLSRSEGRELLHAAGATSTPLALHAASTPADALVLFDVLDPLVHDVVDRSPADRPTLVVPLASPSPLLSLCSVAECLGRAAAVIVWSGHEQAHVSDLVRSERLHRCKPVVRTHEQARRRRSERHRPASGSVILTGTWTAADGPGAARLAAEMLSELDIDLRVVGPGCRSLPDQLGVPGTERSMTRWRSYAAARCVLDVRSPQLLALDVLEAMSCGAPVVVPADGGSAREHVEDADGGLWFRTADELLSCVEALGDGEVADRLGSQGREHVASWHGDTRGFVEDVQSIVRESVLR